MTTPPPRQATALPTRPFGRPDGLRALGVFAIALAAAAFTLGTPKEAPPAGLAVPWLTSTVAEWTQAVAALIGVNLFVGAHVAGESIRSGRRAPGRRGRWAAVTCASGLAVFAVVPLRLLAAEDRHPRPTSNHLIVVGLLVCGGVLTFVGWQEFRGVRRRRPHGLASVARVFGAAPAEPGAKVAPEPSGGAGEIRRYVEQQPLRASGGGFGGLRVSDPPFLPPGVMSSLGSTPTAKPVRLVKAARPRDEDDPVKAVPGLRVTGLLLAAGLALAFVYAAITNLLSR